MTELDVAAQLRAFVAYNERANTIVLDAIAALSPEELDRAHRARGDILRASTQRVVTAQDTWLGRWGCSVRLDVAPSGWPSTFHIQRSVSSLRAGLPSNSRA